MNLSRITRLLQKVTTFDKLSKDEIIYILRKVNVDKERKCWFYKEDWSVYVVYKKKPLHRLIFETFKEPINNGKIVCHHCDRPGCINPNHLYQGTHKDNARDSWDRNRRIEKLPRTTSFSKEFEELKERDRRKQLRRFAGSSYVNWYCKQ